MPRRGRPKVYETDEARQAADKLSRAKARLKRRNISVEKDIVDALNATADALEAKLGFRPTLSQTLRYLLKNVPGNPTNPGK